MHHTSSSSGSRAIQPGADKRVSIHRYLWIVTLLLLGLTTGVVVVAQTTIPNWWGTEPTNISGDLPIQSWQPVIASDPSSGLLVVAWSNPPSEGAKNNIYTSHSTDNGYSWSDPTEIIATAMDSFKPDLTIAQDQIFVTWAEAEEASTPIIYEAERTPSTSWEIHQIPISQSLDISARPHLAIGGGKLHIVFSDEKDANILYVARPITANTWMTATTIYTHTVSNEYSRYPVLAVAPDGQTLHLVWQESTFDTGEDVIKYMQGQASGDSVVWGPVDILSQRNQDMVEPDIVIDSGGNVHVIWVEVGALGTDEQYIRYTHNTGGSWMTPTMRIDPDQVRVHDSLPYFVTPKIAAWGAGEQMALCVVWHGYRTDDVIEGATEEILATCSYDMGNSWPPPKNVSHSSANDWSFSINPSIAFDIAGQLQVVWQEHAVDGLAQDYQIYYSHAVNVIFLPLIVRIG